MVNFDTLTAEILSLVWRTPSNFNGFRVLAALLHGSSRRQPKFAALNGGRHGAPPMFGRATITFGMAHILVISNISTNLRLR